MTNEEFKKTVAKNLVFYRKMHGYTQLQLAELTNYSDKAISKWERGESLPDMYVLYQLADFYGVTLNDLLVAERKVRVPASRRAKGIITLISFLSVWLIAAIVFAVLFIAVPEAPNGLQEYYWMLFIYAIPLSCLVAYILAAIWFRDTPLTIILLSGFAWTLGVSLHLSLSLRDTWSYAWLIYIILIFVQVIIILAYWLINIRKQQRLSIFAWIRIVISSIGTSIKNWFRRAKNTFKKKEKPKKDIDSSSK